MADHGHSHSGPNAHSHGPQPNQPALTPQQIQQLQQLTPQQLQQLQQLQQQQQQQLASMTPDPDVLAALDARFEEVPLKLVINEEKKGQAIVEATSSDMPFDFKKLNLLAQQIMEACPNNGDVPPPVPPPQMIQKNLRSIAVIKAKDEGNKLYGQGKHQEAITLYTNAAKLTVSRPPWESSALVKEELAMLLSNRSAAYAIIGDWVAALADADAVINYKRPWSKGHFRKAKALQGLGEHEEAKAALSLGLAFEPSNAVWYLLVCDVSNADFAAFASRAESVEAMASRAVTVTSLKQMSLRATSLSPSDASPFTFEAFLPTSEKNDNDNDNEIIKDLDTPHNDLVLLPSPPTSWLSAKDMRVFGATPLTASADIGIIRCKDCQKPILKSVIVDHTENCKRIRLGPNAEMLTFMSELDEQIKKKADNQAQKK